MRTTIWQSTFVLGCLLATGVSAAGPRVDVVVDEKAPALERFAAEELAAQFRRLFDADVKIVDKAPADSAAPDLYRESARDSGNSVARRDVAEALRPGALLTQCRHRQRERARGGWRFAGGDSLGGVRTRLSVWYSLHAVRRPVPDRPAAAETRRLRRGARTGGARVRTWRTVNDFPIGPESWGLAEQERVLRQLAKLKFNRVMLAFYPWQPFVDFRIQRREEGDAVFRGSAIDIPSMATRQAARCFAEQRFSKIPTSVGRRPTPNESQPPRATGARHHERCARQLGMSTGHFHCPLLEFPRGNLRRRCLARKLYSLEQLTIGPGAAQRTDDATLMGLVKTQIRAYIKTYPDLDYVYLSLPEFPGVGANKPNRPGRSSTHGPEFPNRPAWKSSPRRPATAR